MGSFSNQHGSFHPFRDRAYSNTNSNSNFHNLTASGNNNIHNNQKNEIDEFYRVRPETAGKKISFYEGTPSYEPQGRPMSAGRP